MKKNRMKFLIIEFLLLLLAVFFVWKIFDQNVAEPRIAVILPESGDKRWDALIKGMKQAAAENNVHMIICNTEEIDGPEAEREFIREQKDNDIDGFIIYPAPGHEGPSGQRTAKPSLPESDTGWQGFTRSCRRTAAGWTRNGRSYRPLYRIFPIR